MQECLGVLVRAGLDSCTSHRDVGLFRGPKGLCWGLTGRSTSGSWWPYKPGRGPQPQHVRNKNISSPTFQLQEVISASHCYVICRYWIFLLWKLLAVRGSLHVSGLWLQRQDVEELWRKGSEASMFFIHGRFLRKRSSGGAEEGGDQIG